MSDLLPCPFCEHPSEMYPEHLIQGMFTAWCPKCQASMWKATKAEAIAAWNRRAGRQAERDSERTPQPEPADGDPISRAVDRAVQLTREQEVEPLREAAQKMADGIAKLRKVWQEEGDFRVESRGLHVDITVGDALMAMDEGESAFRALLAGGEGGGE